MHVAAQIQRHVIFPEHISKAIPVLYIEPTLRLMADFRQKIVVACTNHPQVLIRGLLQHPLRPAQRFPGEKRLVRIGDLRVRKIDRAGAIPSRIHHQDHQPVTDYAIAQRG